MALTLIKEDGTGKVDANSYADVADGDAYHDGHLYAAAWTGASSGDKEKALVFATRLIDAECRFNGWKSHDLQALQWPRERCHDPDKGPPLSILLLPTFGTYVLSYIVPKAIIDATCEMARELLIADRTLPPPGEGLLQTRDANTTASADKNSGVSSSSSSSAMVKYSKPDTRPIITHVAQAILLRYGSVVGNKSGTVRLVRT